jgi:hypothetical protein
MGDLKMDINDENKLKKKKDLLNDALEKFKDYADVNEDSDIPITEKKVKDKKWLE